METRFHKVLEYCNTFIIPKYSEFDAAHKEDHAHSVINRSNMYAMEYNKRSDCYQVDLSIVYVNAAFHDLGLIHGRANHGFESAKILWNDDFIHKMFDFEERIIMAEAIEDHRTKFIGKRRTIYGKILADGDKETDPVESVKRLWKYRMDNKYYHNMADDERFKDMTMFIRVLYAPGGKMHSFELNLPGQNELLYSLKNKMFDEDFLRSVIAGM